MMENLKGQARVIAVVRQLVDEWRGFPLGSAADPFPMEPPRYEPTREGERPLSETSRRLLQHWFRQEPHLLAGKGRVVYPFKYWPHQRRFVETVIYLHEVRRNRRTEDLYALAVLLEKARGVTSWIYNQRGSVGYSIPYDWKGYASLYFPDFFVRAKLGEVFHNFIIEVKGRLDDRDKEKARCGQRHCDLLSAHDREPWHYLFLVENEPLGRQDITWWKHQSVVDIGDLLRRQESMPLLPDGEAAPATAAQFTRLDSVPAEDRFRDALPVHDLAAAAGGFSEGQVPEVIGWARVSLSRRLDRRMFIARVKGRSMEPRVPTGAWCVFRAFPVGETPGSVALDGRRVVVQLRDVTDPETGGRYTLKRWRVTKVGAEGGADEVELQPDNPAFEPMRFSGGQVDIRVVAELLEVIG
jgi:hypothetical protein